MVWFKRAFIIQEYIMTSIKINNMDVDHNACIGIFRSAFKVFTSVMKVV